jgi:hypothetical protein
VITIDIETLGVVSRPHRYTRIDSHTWEYTSLASGAQQHAVVDECGFVVNEHEVFRRVIDDAHNS